MSSLWLRPGATIGHSIAEQSEEAERLGPTLLESPEGEWVAAIGMSRAEAMARLLSLVLYLRSEDTDVTAEVSLWPTLLPERGASRRW